jgi:2,3-bisphosphoglycerate-dependent phosphoglycerate mutase
MATLAEVRHGESTWNAKGVWTGWKNPPLSEKGIEEARKAGEQLRGTHFDVAYVSDLLRARQTLDEILKVLNSKPLIIESQALRERNYGDYTEKNKWEIQKQLGDEEFKKLRRGYDYPIPNGESLKDVYDRIVPYFEKEIKPRLMAGKNILISAHGNSLRALDKYLENISNEDIADLEISTGQVIIYQIDEQGKIASKEIKTA